MAVGFQARKGVLSVDNNKTAWFLLAIAESVRAAGMTAENMQRQTLGQSMAYDDDSFEISAQKIEGYANLIQKG